MSKKKAQNEIEAFWWGPSGKPAKSEDEGFVSQLPKMIKSAVREVIAELDREAEADPEPEEEPTGD